jgi:hypothetical protein
MTDLFPQLTINLAFGGNSALESTAALINGLNRELKARPNQKMSKETISRIFEEYQELRRPRMKKVLNLAYQMTRLQAWDGRFMKFIQRYIVPLMGDDRVADHFADLVKGGVKLDYVPLQNPPSGTVPWDDELPLKGSLAGFKRSSTLGFWAVGLILSLNLSYYIVSLLRNQNAIWTV